MKYFISLSSVLICKFSTKYSSLHIFRINSITSLFIVCISFLTLTAILSFADVFVNPTREDNFPTVNIESLACGTPVITFNTGGSVEIPDETCGAVVECEDVEGLLSKIHEFKAEPKSEEKCLLRAQMFDKDLNYEKYIALYKEL